MANLASRDRWPSLVYKEIAPTVDYLHRLLQIGGKYTLDQPFEPNWGHVVLSVTPRGFSTPTLYEGDVVFAVDYEVLDDRVTVRATTGTVSLPLASGTVAGFYMNFLEKVAPLGIEPLRTTFEPEISNAQPLNSDWEERPYDADIAHQVWSAFASASEALIAWQAPFRGHRPRVGIMWGGFDLAATRYNGRRLDPPTTMPVFQQNGMTEEVVEVGFYIGDEQFPEAVIFSYIAPAPKGIEAADFGVEGASYSAERGLITLPWEAVCASDDPKATIIRFGDAVYKAAIELGGWPDDLTGSRHDGWYASTHLVFER